MTQRIDRTIDVLHGQLDHLGEKLPHARAVILTELANLGLPAGKTYDGVRITGTKSGKDGLTSVEANANRRVHLNTKLQGFDDELNAVSLIVTTLLHECDRTIGRPVEVYRCDGGVGRDGYDMPREGGGWSDPACWNVPEEGRTTCDPCRMRASRWKRQQAEEDVA